MEFSKIDQVARKTIVMIQRHGTVNLKKIGINSTIDRKENIVQDWRE